MSKFPVLVLVMASLALSQTGCWIVSLTPIYRDADVVFRPELVGIWKGTTDWVGGKFGPSEVILEVTEGRDGNYLVHYTQDGTTYNPLEAYLVKLGDQYYADIFPENSNASIERGLFPFLAFHVLYLVKLDGDALRLGFLEEDFLNEQATSGQPVAIDGGAVFTASTEVLQRVLPSYAAQEGALVWLEWERVEE